MQEEKNERENNNLETSIQVSSITFHPTSSIASNIGILQKSKQRRRRQDRYKLLLMPDIQGLKREQPHHQISRASTSSSPPQLPSPPPTSTIHDHRNHGTQHVPLLCQRSPNPKLRRRLPRLRKILQLPPHGLWTTYAFPLYLLPLSNLTIPNRSQRPNSPLPGR